MTAQFLSMVVTAPLSGRIADRVGSRGPATTGMAILAVGLFMLSAMNGESPLLFVVFSLIVTGAGGWRSSLRPTTARCSEPRRREGRDRFGDPRHLAAAGHGHRHSASRARSSRPSSGPVGSRISPERVFKATHLAFLSAGLMARRERSSRRRDARKGHHDSVRPTLREIAGPGGEPSETPGSIVREAVRELRFTIKDSEAEVDISIDRLKMFADARPILEGRRPLGGRGSSVSLMLSYNGSTWLNTAITSIYMVGNRLNVKFSSKGSALSRLTESIYRPIFGDDIRFTREGGKGFMERSLKDPGVSAVVAFARTRTSSPTRRRSAAAARNLSRRAGAGSLHRLSRRGPRSRNEGSRFLEVLLLRPDVRRPKRILVHRSIYEGFLAQFEERVRRLVAGSPEGPRTNVSPWRARWRCPGSGSQLKEAAAMGAKVVCGGTIEANLIHPTIVRDATDGMLGMREEVFGPVAFTSPFDTKGEAVARAKGHKYGLRAALFGGEEAAEAATELVASRIATRCRPTPSESSERSH